VITQKEIDWFKYGIDPYEEEQVFNMGQRVEAHPGCDCWMQGDRYGEVIAQFGWDGTVFVRMDKSNKVRRFPPNRLKRI